jgi:hypothetical protein
VVNQVARANARRSAERRPPSRGYICSGARSSNEQCPSGAGSGPANGSCVNHPARSRHSLEQHHADGGGRALRSTSNTVEFIADLNPSLRLTALFRSGAVYGTATPRQLLNQVFKRSGQMIYTEPRQPDTRRFARIRRISMGQWIGLVAGACALAFGIYFVFSYV